jgi:hypothetical protein
MYTLIVELTNYDHTYEKLGGGHDTQTAQSNETYYEISFDSAATLERDTVYWATLSIDLGNCTLSEFSISGVGTLESRAERSFNLTRQNDGFVVLPETAPLNTSSFTSGRYY